MIRVLIFFAIVLTIFGTWFRICEKRRSEYRKECLYKPGDEIIIKPDSTKVAICDVVYPAEIIFISCKGYQKEYFVLYKNGEKIRIKEELIYKQINEE